MLPILSQNEADLTACFAQDIAVTARVILRNAIPPANNPFSRCCPPIRSAFSRASIRVLARESTAAAGLRYVLHLLRKHNLLIDALADPMGSRREDAVAAARMIPRVSAPLDSDLERALSGILSETPSAAKAGRVLRLLDVLEAASPQPRLYLFQSELLSYPDSTVRSKSALLIARSSKSAALVGRLLLDDDGRVQANAVEALWTFDPAEAHPLLLMAARSKTPRVAGNAAVGLYLVGDLSSLQLLFRMAQEEDPARRTTAAWAMGETGDPRFLPFLTAWFPRSTGNERVNVLQALGRIRRREKSLCEAGAIDIRVWSANLLAAGADPPRRRLVVTLWSPEKADLSLKPTQFAIREGGCSGAGLRSLHPTESGATPFRVCFAAILLGVGSIRDRGARMRSRDAWSYKRADDLWRLDRYLIEPRADTAGALLQTAGLPFDESLLGRFAKTQQRGFLAAPEALEKIMHSPGSKERATDDVIAAFYRQSEAMIKFSGKRKVFLFLYPDCARRLERHIVRLRSFVASERISVHGIAPKGASGCEDFQGLCLTSEGGSFEMLTPAEIPAEVERIYAQSLNRFEVTYRVPEQATGEGSLQITSESGCGQASFSLN